MPTHIGLPDEHAHRIKAFAASRNISAPDAVGVLIQIAIENNHIPAGLPGYSVKRSGDKITISHEAGYKRTFDIKLARAFATALDWTARSKAGDDLPSTLNSLALTHSGAEQHVGVKRRGTAIRIVDETGNERTLAPSVATELALMVDRIAAA